MDNKQKLKTKAERREEEKRKAQEKSQRGATLAGQVKKTKISREFKGRKS